MSPQTLSVALSSVKRLHMKVRCAVSVRYAPTSRSILLLVSSAESGLVPSLRRRWIVITLSLESSTPARVSVTHLSVAMCAKSLLGGLLPIICNLVRTVVGVIVVIGLFGRILPCTIPIHSLCKIMSRAVTVRGSYRGVVRMRR